MTKNVTLFLTLCSLLQAMERSLAQREADLLQRERDVALREKRVQQRERLVAIARPELQTTEGKLLVAAEMRWVSGASEDSDCAGRVAVCFLSDSQCTGFHMQDQQHTAYNTHLRIISHLYAPYLTHLITHNPHTISTHHHILYTIPCTIRDCRSLHSRARCHTHLPPPSATHDTAGSRMYRKPRYSSSDAVPQPLTPLNGAPGSDYYPRTYYR